MDNTGKQDNRNAGINTQGDGGVSNQVGGTVTGQTSGQNEPHPKPQNPVGTMAKESGPMPASGEQQDSVEIREYGQEFEVSPEVQEYVEKVDKENLELDKKVVHKGKPVISPPQGMDEPNIMIPLTQGKLQVGLKQKVGKSFRWLAEWCLRIIKKFHGKVVYYSDDNK